MCMQEWRWPVQLPNLHHLRDDRGWDAWLASLTQWTWVWANSGSWWRTGRSGSLQFMGLQRVGHDWATELTDWGSLVGEGNGIPLQYSCLENPMDGGAWWAAVHGVAKSRTRLSDFTFTFHFPALEKEMATHSSVLAWRIPWTGEPGGLLSVGSHRVGHDWSDAAAAVGNHVTGDDVSFLSACLSVINRAWVCLDLLLC